MRAKTRRLLQQRLRRSINLQSYLRELSDLIGRPVRADELSSPEQAAEIRARAEGLIAEPAASTEVPFSDRMTERFRSFIQRLQAANPSSIQVWTPKTIDCGVIEVPSLAAVRFDFDFSINDDGILSFVTSGLTDRLLLDFSASLSGHQRMTIEVQGQSWSRVTY